MNSRIPILLSLRFLPFWIALLLLCGCASHEYVINAPKHDSEARFEDYATATFTRVHDVFTPIRLQTKADKQQLQVKVSNLLVLIDTSLDEQAPEHYSPYFLPAYEALHRFVHSTPDLPLQTSVFEIGQSARYSLSDLQFTAGQQNLAQVSPRFDLHELDLKLEKRDHLPSLGQGQLAESLDILTANPWQFSEPLTLLIIAPWQQINVHSIRALNMFKKRMAIHQGVCVYMIGIGARHSRSRFDNAEDCGFSVSAEWIAQPAEMAYFVERMMYSFPADTDNDGIYDFVDQCPDSLPGRIVNSQGCYQFTSGRSH
ncbi:hypothetical protein [Alteromonas lipolytica]|uniref:Uncharacterized protein n=1 Tax=Alteromonas lipolytica TaxID=1856405 RepID=A0A1E8FAV7_9ALTE|nr:hypothetical protein [Alteromonas lipolytica]OFI33067.1 hypothetical protein BFC17_02005 [Alteromonas lipolytica]GGF62771.1 hypothetical protein GCM10011338_14060 [Alteromonas lipolytica]